MCFKDMFVRDIAIGEATLIAWTMGLCRTKDLSSKNRLDLTDISDTSDISTNDLRSFHRADLIIEATDQAGEVCYIAVEVSYTAHGGDITRAVRNASFLTKFTGKPAYAVVAGMYQDDRIQDSIDSSEVFWYQMDPDVLR